MRFDTGLHAHAGDISGYPHIDEWLEMARFCESAGLTGVWVAEHHFCWDGWGTPTPTNTLQFGSFLAGQTTRLRIGQCGVPLPDRHPIMVAEDIALLDHMSNGRVDFGVLPGINNRVNGNFRREADRRDQATNRALFWDCFDIIQKAFTGEPFSHKSDYFELPMPGWIEPPVDDQPKDPRYYSSEGELIALSVLPQPLQRPGPPTYLMADSPSSHAEAARRGLNVVSWGRSLEAQHESMTAFTGARPDSAASHVAAMRPFFVAESMSAAADVMRDSINVLLDRTSYTNPLWGRKQFLASTEEYTPAMDSKDWFEFLFDAKWAICGTPDYVAESIAELEALGINHVICYWALPNLSREQVMGSMRLFADKVMPHFTNDLVAQG
jgi:alkanesulfonate monooxygenase SsuD/methylene tetrahydromethanopterin reductase-like flavin-dependent oxidoreductase (luciferase family)